jgi:3-oxoacyl-[acyl-carrier-protein] synthase II
VTGMGVVTSLGAGKQDNWDKLTAGKSGIRAIKRFSTEGLKTRIGGTVDFVPVDPLTSPALAGKLADMAAEEAVAQSGVGSKGHFPGPLFLAVAPVEVEWPQRMEVAKASGANDQVSYADLIRAAASGRFKHYHDRFQFSSVADGLATKFGTEGAPVSLSTACASGASAIQLGFEAIRRGETDAALCVATDGSVNVESLIRFSLLSALSMANDPPEGASKPFSKNRDGFVMAEGAGALVLESYEAATARGANILGVLAGCGELADSFHRTRSSPDGKPIVGCMRNALDDAGLTPADIDYINAHGSGTKQNDRHETSAYKASLGDHAYKVPISSIKSMVGHSLGAIGAIEMAACALAIEHGVVPPTANWETRDPECDLDYIPKEAREMRVDVALSVGSGFGGFQSAMLLTRPGLLAGGE